MNKIAEMTFDGIKLGDFIKLKGLQRGMVIYLDDNVSTAIFIGDGIGWNFSSDYCLCNIKKIEWYEIPNTVAPPDFRKLIA